MSHKGTGRGYASKHCDIPRMYRQTAPCNLLRTSRIASTETKIHEAHRLRSLLHGDDDEALRKADNKFMTSLHSLNKQNPSDRNTQELERIETKQRLEDENILKPSKFQVPVSLKPSTRQLLEKKLEDLEGSGELMEKHPASDLALQAEEVLQSIDAPKRGRPKKEVLFVDRPNSKTTSTFKSTQKKQLTKALIDTLVSIIETDSNKMMRASTRTKLKALTSWLSSSFPETQTDVPSVSGKIVSQFAPIVQEHYSIQDSVSLIAKLNIENMVQESLNVIFSQQSEDGKMNIPKAIQHLRTLGTTNSTTST